MASVNVKSAEFEGLIEKGGIMLVDFWAEWCGPCRMFGPVYEKVSEEFPEITFAKIDTEAEREIAAAAGITSIPTLMAFRDGVLLYREAGALPEPSLRELIASIQAVNMDDIRKQIAEEAANKKVSNAAAEKWKRNLASWAIPQEILEQAEVAPWVHPPALFALPEEIKDSPSHVKAREALSAKGTVLDIGCGGGVATFAVAKHGNHVIGVDHQAEMLEMYSQNAKVRNIDSEVHEGFWPAIAEQVPVAEVVTVHHVVYNVGDIEPFLKALNSHASKRVVIELPLVHPMTSASAGWEHFWKLVRPTSPNADDLLVVLNEMGISANIEKFSADFPLDQSADEIAERTRVRLCLPPSRLNEVKEFLLDHPFVTKRDLAVIWWDKV